jgi:phosphoserine phosphatase RsbU/P
MLNSSWLVRFLREQGLYLSIAAIVSAIFWAIGQHVNPGTVVLYSVLFGNLETPLLNRVACRAMGRPFPYDWLLFLAALLILTPFIYAISSVVVWWIAPPSPQTLGHLLTTGWKFPFLLIVVYGIISFAYTQSKERLERRNTELQRSLELSAAKLEVQEEDLRRAREIQESLLPKAIPQVPGFELAAAWQPARAVGGDYYDVVRLDQNRLGVCIADVVGKGVSAALLMANVQAIVRAFAGGSESPAQLCDRVNSVLCGNIDIGKFVTFFYGVLDASQRTFQYCNAGHPRPIVLSSDSIRELSEGGAVLGVFPNWKYEDATIELCSGDRLLLFTDGITEAAAADGQEFGEDKLAEVVKSSHIVSAAELNARVLARVNEFCAGHFQDDATLLVIATC